MDKPSKRTRSKRSEKGHESNNKKKSTIKDLELEYFDYNESDIVSD